MAKLEIPAHLNSLLVPLSEIDFFYDDQNHVAVVKKQPIGRRRGCGHRHYYFYTVQNFIPTGGVKLFPVQSKDPYQVYKRVLPYGEIKLLERLYWDGYAVFERVQPSKPIFKIKPAEKHFDAALVILHHYVNSREHGAEIDVHVLDGEIIAEAADSTGCAAEAEKTVMMLVKPPAKLLVIKNRGPYRGPDSYSVSLLVLEEGHVEEKELVEDVPEKEEAVQQALALLEAEAIAAPPE